MSRLARPTDRQALAAFVRDRRSRVRPEDVGLGAGTRRRTPGLRREEVAHLAGIGLTWYTWFEQGRDIQVSADFLERLSRAFGLTADERTHLFALARHSLPQDASPRATEVSVTVRAILASLPGPAYVMTKRWDVVAWNDPADTTFGFADVPAEMPNILRLVFTAPAYRHLMVDWESDARRTLEKFRLDCARAGGDPGFDALVAELSERSADFRRWWPRQDVRSVGEGVKRIRCPQGGETEYGHAVFGLEAAPNLRLVVYVRRS